MYVYCSYFFLIKQDFLLFRDQQFFILEGAILLYSWQTIIWFNWITPQLRGRYWICKEEVFGSNEREFNMQWIIADYAFGTWKLQIVFAN